MRMLLIHARSFYISSVKQSTRPGDIVSIKNHNNGIRLDDSLISFVTVEYGDAIQEAENAVSEIGKVLTRIRNSETALALIPFAHLSDNLESPPAAYDLIESMYEKLRQEFSSAHIVLGDFGFNNEWGLDAYSHPLSCVFRKV